MFLTPAMKQQVIRSYGNFRVGGATGLLTGAAGASDIVSFRWGSTTKDCIVWWVRWWWYLTTGFTGAQLSDHALYKAQGFSGSPSGGTSLVPAAGMQKRKTSHADSALTAFQIATTGALTVGTRTLDSLPMIQRGAWCIAGAGNLAQLAEKIDMPDPDSALLYLTTNEGFVIQNITAMGAGGVQKFQCEVGWSEILPDAMFMPDNLTV
jgi:hypothetical protein